MDANRATASTSFGNSKLILKLGIISFGRPAVYITLMQKEVVRKRAWITEEHLLD